MWLLSTDRAELHFFVSPESVPGGYAILSHVWDKEEQSFQDIQKLCERCANYGTNPRDHASAKIRECCILAERHGYDWVWIDTCCIDKTSSAELSEAINSMYRYYSLAEVCYAYLRDVPSDDVLHEYPSAFWYSRWHRRGWTLQELIAPLLLVFLSMDWEMLGTKAELASLLEDITQVPATVLTQAEGLGEISVARRMSWAADRETTRLEDEAYCLMGIFSINMPTIYGEGRQAFRRLQEEIMKQDADMSLFAWGKCVYDLDRFVPHNGTHDHRDPELYLLAESPAAFKSCADIMFTPPTSAADEPLLWERMPQLHKSSVTDLETSDPESAQLIPTFSITPYGVRARIPVFQVLGYTVAVLFCSNEDAEVLGLFLTPCHDTSSPLRLRYHCGTRIPLSGTTCTVRLLPLGDDIEDLVFFGFRVDPVWRDIYITHRPPPGTSTQAVPRFFTNSSISTPFRFPKRGMEKMLNNGFQLDDLTQIHGSWTGSTPLALIFRDRNVEDVTVLHLGRCTLPTQPSPSGELSPPEELGSHWANIQFYDSDPPPELPAHACPADHISEWSNRTRTFETARSVLFPSSGKLRHKAYVTLAFTPCLLNPANTLVMNIAEAGDELIELEASEADSSSASGSG